MPRLENWGVVNRNPNPYAAPELAVQALSGNIYNHVRFEDGTFITTSKIIYKKGKKVLAYSGSEYELGEVAEEYETLYPNAKERLLNSLEEKEEV